MNTKQHQTECTGSDPRDATPSVAAAGQVEVAPLRQASRQSVDLLAAAEQRIMELRADRDMYSYNGIAGRAFIQSQIDKAIAERDALITLIAAARKLRETHIKFRGNYPLPQSSDYAVMTALDTALAACGSRA